MIDEIKTKNYTDLFYKILRIRRIEEAISRRYSEQEMRCPTHLSIGQEATPVGVVANLLESDYMMSTHRSHAHYLAKGGASEGLIAELYGKKTGCSGGHGGSMHLIDLSVNFLGSTSIVGGTVPVGVGAGFAAKIRKEKRVSVVCIGDTVLEEGVFHESMNFAALHKLPVFFMCENNFYSCFSGLEVRQPPRPLTDVAKAHDIKSYQMDGNDVYAIYEETQAIVESVRNGHGPVFVEFKTYRQMEHCGPSDDDHLNYRLPTDIEYWKQKDPIEVARKKLQKMDLWSTELEAKLEALISSEIENIFEQAIAASYPSTDELGAFTYAP